MVFNLFRKLTASSKLTPNSISYFALITFNTYSKKFTNQLIKILKSSDETSIRITCNSSVVNT